MKNSLTDGAVKKCRRTVALQEDHSTGGANRLEADAAALKRLNEASAQLWHTQDLHEGLDRILGATIEMMGADFATVHLYDPSARVLRMAAQRGFKASFVDRFYEISATNMSASGRALRLGRRIMIEDVKVDANYAPYRAHARAAGYRAVTSTPLLARDKKPLGMISTLFRSPHRPDEGELHRLDLYARQASDFIERCERERELRDREERLRLALNAAEAGTFAWNAATKAVSWDDRFHTMCGLGESAPRTLKTWLSLVYEADESRVVKAISRLQHPVNGRWNIDFRLVRPDGGLVWHHALGHTVCNGNGEVIRLNGILIDITERKLFESAAQDASERLKKVVANDAVGVMFWDLKTGRMTDANEKFLRMLGYSRTDVESGRLTWEKLTPPEYLEVSRAEIRKFQATGRVGPYQKEYLKKDGTRLWLGFAGSSLGNNECVEFCIDISERKKAEAALKKLNAELDAERIHWRSVVEGIADEVWVCDRLGRISLINLPKTTAMGLKEFKEQEIWDVLKEVDIYYPNGDPRPPEDAPILKSIRTGKILRGEEIMYSRRTGKRRHRQFSCAPTRDIVTGKVTGAVAIVRDITDLKDAEASVKASEERYRGLFESSRDGIGITDMAGNLMDANSAFQRMLGYSLEELRRLTYQEISLPRWHASESQILKEQVLKRGYSDEYEKEYLHKSGEVIPVSLRTWLVHDEKGEPSGYWAIVRDITERRELEHAVSDISEREQNRIGQELHDGICQELTAIEFRLCALADRLQSAEEKQATETRQIAAQVRQAIGATRKLAHGLSPLILTPDGLMGGLRELAEAISKTFRIECRFECPSNVLFKDALTSSNLYRIAQEAVSNAIRHGRATAVRIRLRRRKNHAALRVTDNGIGLPQQRKGDGMGLRIMEYRARIIHGTLTVQRGRRGGTEVICTVDLPSSRHSAAQ